MKQFLRLQGIKAQMYQGTEFGKKYNKMLNTTLNSTIRTF